MTSEERAARIAHMEQLMDRSSEAYALLEQALCRYEEAERDMQQLAEYYFDGGPWMQDCEADAAGLLPQGLKRGVLSEDALWDLFVQRRELQQDLQRLSALAETEADAE